jgi:hypothetical protein
MNFNPDIAVGIHLLDVVFIDIEALCRTRVVFRVKFHEFGLVNIDFYASCFAKVLRVMGSSAKRIRSSAERRWLTS